MPALFVVVLFDTAQAAFALGLQRMPALFCVEILGFGEGDALISAKPEGALPSQEYAGRMLHDRACRKDWVARSEYSGYRAGAKIAAVHQRSIHFLSAGCGENAPPSRVEQRIIFKRDSRLGHGINRISATREDTAAGSQRPVQSLMVERGASRRSLPAADRSGAAMNR